MKVKIDRVELSMVLQEGTNTYIMNGGNVSCIFNESDLTVTFIENDGRKNISKVNISELIIAGQQVTRDNVIPLLTVAIFPDANKINVKSTISKFTKKNKLGVLTKNIVNKELGSLVIHKNNLTYIFSTSKLSVIYDSNSDNVTFVENNGRGVAIGTKVSELEVDGVQCTKDNVVDLLAPILYPNKEGNKIIVIDSLSSNSTTDALSAAQGKVLDDKIDLKADLIDGKIDISQLPSNFGGTSGINNIIYVDERYGESTEDGSEQRPFKTVQKALDYIEENGITYPAIIIPPAHKLENLKINKVVRFYTTPSRGYVTSIIGDNIEINTTSVLFFGFDVDGILNVDTGKTAYYEYCDIRAALNLTTGRYSFDNCSFQKPIVYKCTAAYNKSNKISFTNCRTVNLDATKCIVYASNTLFLANRFTSDFNKPACVQLNDVNNGAFGDLCWFEGCTFITGSDSFINTPQNALEIPIIITGWSWGQNLVYLLNCNLDYDRLFRDSRYTDTNTKDFLCINDGTARFYRDYLMKLPAKVDTKQDKLIAGTNIGIVSNGDGTATISSTGGATSNIVGGRNYLYFNPNGSWGGVNYPPNPKVRDFATLVPTTNSFPVSPATFEQLGLVGKEVTLSASLHRSYTSTAGYIYFQLEDGTKLGDNINISSIPNTTSGYTNYYNFKHTFVVPASAKAFTKVQIVLVNVDGNNCYLMWKNGQLEIGNIVSDYKKPIEKLEVEVYQQVTYMRDTPAMSGNYMPNKILFNESIKNTLVSTNPIQNINGTNYFDCFEDSPKKVLRTRIMPYDNSKINSHELNAVVTSTYPGDKYLFLILWFDENYNLLIPEYYNMYWMPYCEVRPDTMMIWNPEELKQYRNFVILIKDKDGLDLDMDTINAYPFKMNYGGGFKTSWSPSIKDSNPLIQVVNFDFNQSKPFIIPNNSEVIILRKIHGINNIYVKDAGDTSINPEDIKLEIDKPYRFTRAQFESRMIELVCDNFGGVVELEFY